MTHKTDQEMKAEIIAQHYQNTFEFTLALWKERNRSFLFLLFVVGIGALLSFNVSQAEPLLIDFIAKFFDVDNADRLNELRLSFPYGLIQSIILMIVLYLMIQLYHRTININRNYAYMSHLEIEIRKELQISRDEKSFSREGDFYWKTSPSFSKQIGVAYILILGILLMAFLVMRVKTDIITKNTFAIFADSILAIITLIFFFMYAYSASSIIATLYYKIKRRFNSKKQSNENNN